MTDDELHTLVKSIEAPDTVDSLSNGFYTLTPDELLALINKIRDEDAEICESWYYDPAKEIRARKT